MRLRALAVALGLLACSAERHPGGSHGMTTPLRADAGTPAASADGGTRPGETMSLEQFAPLLTDPVLVDAAAAVESGAPGKAAAQVEAAMQQRTPSAVDLPRWYFLLARLREQADQMVAAAEAYRQSANAEWPLRGYASLGAGRALVAAGKPDAAVTELQRVPADLPVTDQARLLMADVAAQKQDRPRAVLLWREHLRTEEHPRQWVRVSVRLSEALLDEAAASGADAAATTPMIEEALHLARRVALSQVIHPQVQKQATKLEQRALAALPAADRTRLQLYTFEDQLIRLQALLAAQEFEQTIDLADALLKPHRGRMRWSDALCEIALVRVKAVAGDKTYGRAVDSITGFLSRCSNADVLARALYLGGKYAANDGRHAQAVKLYERLEREHAGHRLADDARLRAAYSHYRLGAEARFTELLSKMPEDYPQGDMVLDGIFRLALRRIEKGDWSGAASVLDRGAALVEGNDHVRGTEYSGRERYFRARAWIATGERERGLDEYAALITEVPLSYYMLHAYARLVQADPLRAKRVRDAAVLRATEQPFTFEHHPEFDQPGFVRAMELLRVGEVDPAKREIEVLGLAKRGVAPQLLWGVALLYARAGSAKLSHAIARGLLTDWLGRWPGGDWAQAWQLAFPRPYRAIVTREAKLSGVPESLVYGIMREESAFDAAALSPAGAHGLMQLMPATARAFAKPIGLPHDPASLKRPRINIRLGCRVLAQLTEGFPRNPLLAIPGYNAGPGRPRQWIRNRPGVDFDVWVELIPFRETRRYTKRVLASRAAYAYLYEPATADAVMALPIKLDN